MTIDQAVARIRSIRYKPGWRITCDVRSDWNMALWIELRYDTQDADRSGRPATIVMQDMIDAYRLFGRAGKDDEQYLDEYMFHFLMRAEQHEAGEWFEIGGKRPMDPHAGTPLGPANDKKLVIEDTVLA